MSAVVNQRVKTERTHEIFNPIRAEQQLLCARSDRSEVLKRAVKPNLFQFNILIQNPASGITVQIVEHKAELMVVEGGELRVAVIAAQDRVKVQKCIVL